MSNPPALVKKSAGLAVAGPRDAAVPPLLEYQSPTAAVIAGPVPVASRHTGWVIVAMATSLLAVLGLVPIDRVVNTSGKVSAITGNLSVQPMDTTIDSTSSVYVPAASLVRSIDVKEGQLVHAGDVLAELDPTFAQADQGAMESLVGSLKAEVDRLTAETQNRAYVPDGSPASQQQELLYAQRHAERSAKTEDYAQKIKVVEVAIAQAMSDVATLTERRKLALVVEGKRRQLEHLKVGSQLNRLSATDTRIDIEAQLALAGSQMETARRQLDDLVAQRNEDAQQWMATTSLALTDQGRMLADAREQLNKTHLRRQQVILRAQRDAIVLRVAPVNVGTVMQTGQQFIELVPLDAPLQIDAMVAGADVGFVRVGDPVTIKFDSFPYTLYGTATGTVLAISPDSFVQASGSGGSGASARSGGSGASSSPGGSQSSAPPSSSSQTPSQQAMGVLFFRARMSIDALQLHDLPEGARVVPGMPVEADVRVGKRTVLSYVLSRIIPAASESMREP